MIKHTSRTVIGLVAVLCVSACSATPPADEAGPGVTSSAEGLPPPGYGTLRQDDFTIPLTWGPVQIKVTPLAEGVIRLAAPDTYQRLHGMVASRSEQIRRRAEMVGMRGEPMLFFVSFFTYEQQAGFDPSLLQLLSQGIQFFPQGILPLTPEWGGEQLKQQQTQSAIYLFDPTIDLQVPLEVQYGDRRTRAWNRIIGTLQTEYGRVVSRAKG